MSVKFFPSQVHSFSTMYVPPLPYGFSFWGLHWVLEKIKFLPWVYWGDAFYTAYHGEISMFIFLLRWCIRISIHYLLNFDVSHWPFLWSFRVWYVILSALSISYGREDTGTCHDFSYRSCKSPIKLVFLIHFFFCSLHL